MNTQSAPNDLPEALLTRQQAATILGIHPKTMPRWEKAGRVRAIHLTRRIVRYRRSEVERILRDAEAAIATEEEF